MIFVVKHQYDGASVIDIIHGDELDTDEYQHIDSIFFCENMDEVVMVVDEILNWDIE
jgi:hypothetical protein